MTGSPVVDPAPVADRAGVLRRVGAFWSIAVAIEVLLALVFLGTGADATIEQALTALGLEFNTDLVTAARVVVGYPAAALAVGLSLLQVAAPDLAALTVCARRSGADGLREVRRRLRFWSPEVGARGGTRVWALMVITFLAMNLVTAALNGLTLSATEFQWRPHWSVPGFVAALLVTLFLDAGAVFEESGWRGYALPQLLRRCSPLVASLILGAMWAAWHYPVKFNAFTDYGLAGCWYLAAFTLKIVLLTIVMTYFWQRAGQSTILAVAMHGLSNDSMRLQGVLLGDSLRISVLSELNNAVPLLVVAVVLVWRTRGRLGADARR